MTPEILQDGRKGYLLEGPDIARAARLLDTHGASIRPQRENDAAVFFTDCVVISSAVECGPELADRVVVHDFTGIVIEGLFAMDETTTEPLVHPGLVPPLVKHTAKKR